MSEILSEEELTPVSEAVRLLGAKRINGDDVMLGYAETICGFAPAILESHRALAAKVAELQEHIAGAGNMVDAEREKLIAEGVKAVGLYESAIEMNSFYVGLHRLSIISTSRKLAAHERKAGK